VVAELRTISNRARPASRSTARSDGYLPSQVPAVRLLVTTRWPTVNAAEIAKELVVDLRSELPRIDARAAAGVVLAAAVPVSVVSQAPQAMPIYAIAVVDAAFLTSHYCCSCWSCCLLQHSVPTRFSCD
jgi:hypothetical protein